MGNILLNATGNPAIVIAREALKALKNETVFGGLVHREFKNEYKKIGDTVTIRKPVRFKANQGVDITNSIQDVTEQSTTFTIDYQYNQAFGFSAKDLTMTIDEYNVKYIQPAMADLANLMDMSVAGRYVDVFNASGTAGMTPATFSALSTMAAKMDKLAVPKQGRTLVLEPDAEWAMADALKGSFDKELAKDTVRTGILGQVARHRIYGDQNIKTHTAGTATGMVVDTAASGLTHTTADVAAANDDQSVIYSTTGTGTLVVGDILTIGVEGGTGVHSVNPVSRENTGKLQQFTVKAAVTLGGSGPEAITVSPAIRTSGAYQTVTAAPVDGSIITKTASHVANLAFTRNAFGLVTVPYENFPEGSGVKQYTVSDGGYSATVTIFTDGVKFRSIIRIDIMWGVKTLYPELACRLLG